MSFQVSLQVSEHLNNQKTVIWMVTLQIYVIFAELKFISVRLLASSVYFVKYLLLGKRLPISNRQKITCTKKNTRPKYLYPRQDRLYFLFFLLEKGLHHRGSALMCPCGWKRKKKLNCFQPPFDVVFIGGDDDR